MLDNVARETSVKLVGDLEKMHRGREISEICKTFKLAANASITLAGFALPIVAFVANQLIENLNGIENLVSVVMILLSVVFLFCNDQIIESQL